MRLLATIRWLVQCALRRIYYAFPAPSYYKGRAVAYILRRTPRLRGMAYAFSFGLDEEEVRGKPAEPPGDQVARPRSAGRVLIIDHFTPMPDRDSGSLDVTFTIRALQTLGFEVTFAPFDLARHGRYTADLQGAGVRCLWGPSVISIRQHLRSHGQSYDLVLLYRLEMADLFLNAARRYCPNAKILFSVVDLHFLREARQAEVEGSALRKWHALAARRRELRVVRNADCSLVLSEVERAVLGTLVPNARVAVIPLQRDIPGRRAGFAQRSGVLFIGGFQHPPNVDAARYLLATIWPQIRQRLPGTMLHVIGDVPPTDIAALSGTGGIEIHGHVADIAPFFERCRVSVSPLRFGAGVKGKIGTSMSYGLPCVATSVAAEGMGLTAGTDVLVADDPESFAAAVARLHTDDILWEQFSTNALAFAARNFSPVAGRRQLADLLAGLRRLPGQPVAEC